VFIGWLCVIRCDPEYQCAGGRARMLEYLVSRKLGPAQREDGPTEPRQMVLSPASRVRECIPYDMGPCSDQYRKADNGNPARVNSTRRLHERTDRLAVRPRQQEQERITQLR